MTFHTALFAALFRRRNRTALIRLSGQTVAENASVGTVVGTLSVPYTTGTPTFTLEDDAGGLFVLDGAALEVASALDYESATSHSIEVSVAGTTPDPANRIFTIYVTDVDDTAPTITSANTANVDENVALAHALTANESVTWTIIGGADELLFEISGSTLRFAADATKNYEAPDDADTDNVYVVQVRATDTNSNTADQTISVTVADVDEVPPTITSSSSVSIGDDVALDHALTADEAVTWSIIGGADQSHFTIVVASLQFNAGGSRDFEAPADSDANNAYLVQVRATDALGNTTDQLITVTVQSAESAPGMDFSTSENSQLLALLADDPF